MSETPAGDGRRIEHHMGTTITLHAVGAPREAVDRFFAEIRTLETHLSRFRHDSEVMRLERGELTVDDASPQVREVLIRCDSLRSATRGAFDHRPVIGGRRRLDPNAFAKGWIIEQALIHLRLAGVCSYFVNAGGDVVVGDAPHGQTAWRVGITHPDDPAAVFARLDLVRSSIATSGRYERGDHIRCADGTAALGGDVLTSVSVIGPELATADALATAVFAGGEPLPSWWRRDSPYGIVSVDASGRVLLAENVADVVSVGADMR